MTTTTFLKEAPVTVKAVGVDDGAKAATPDGDIGLAEGEFVALVSVFGNVDSYGDVVMPGAFAKTIAEHESAGDPIPVVWSHRWDDPFAHIGEVVKAWETEDGLLVHAALDLDGNPTAVQVHKLLKSRRVRQFSFAFDIHEAGWGIRKDEATGQEVDVYELRELGLTEVGPCLKGVNRETELRTVKGSPPPRPADDTSKASESLRSDEVSGSAPRITPDQVYAWADIHTLTER